MPLDRALGQKQCRGDLAVRLAFAYERGHFLLGGRELVGRRGAPADPAKLVSRPLGPESGSDAFEDREGARGGAPCPAPPFRPPLGRTKGEERPSPVERELDLRVPDERLFVVPQGVVD